MLSNVGAHLQTTLNRHRSLTKVAICGYLDPLTTGHVTRRMRTELLAFNMGKCKFEVLYLLNSAR